MSCLVAAVPCKCRASWPGHPAQPLPSGFGHSFWEGKRNPENSSRTLANARSCSPPSPTAVCMAWPGLRNQPRRRFPLPPRARCVACFGPPLPTIGQIAPSVQSTLQPRSNYVHVYFYKQPLAFIIYHGDGPSTHGGERGAMCRQVLNGEGRDRRGPSALPPAAFDIPSLFKSRAGFQGQILIFAEVPGQSTHTDSSLSNARGCPALGPFSLSLWSCPLAIICINRPLAGKRRRKRKGVRGVKMQAQRPSLVCAQKSFTRLCGKKEDLSF